VCELVLVNVFAFQVYRTVITVLISRHDKVVIHDIYCKIMPLYKSGMDGNSSVSRNLTFKNSNSQLYS
jgi:hypothetical protein